MTICTCWTIYFQWIEVNWWEVTKGDSKRENLPRWVIAPNNNINHHGVLPKANVERNVTKRGSGIKRWLLLKQPSRQFSLNNHLVTKNNNFEWMKSDNPKVFTAISPFVPCRLLSVGFYIIRLGWIVFPFAKFQPRQW